MSRVASNYSIETADHPLVFKIKAGSVRNEASPVSGAISHRVEVRSLPGMQKEAIVTSRPDGGTWRIVCDEGPYLDGTDLAPFPLAFFTSGLQFCLMAQLQAAARDNQVDLTSLHVTLDNYYTMKGSFIKGDAIGGAKPAQVEVKVECRSTEDAVRGVVQSALSASPGQAVMGDVLENVFSLQVNDRPVPVAGVDPSNHALDPDPLATTFQTFEADPDAPAMPDIITKVREAEQQHGVEGGVSSSLKPVQDRTLHIRGEATALEGRLKQTDIQLLSPIGSSFRLISDEPDAEAPNRAPTALAYLSAGVGFCYMTQLSRYAHIAKLNIDSIRIVQHNGFDVADSGHADAVDTHVFIDAEEADDVINNLVRMGERTCFLHAAMRGTCPSVVRASLNGQPLTL